MNPFAYKTAGVAIKALSDLSKARFRLHAKNNIPKHGAIIFAINHFTRVETLFLPYFFNHITGRTIWSLADYSLFKGTLGNFLEKVGAISTKNPDRDKLIVKSLLTGGASWIIFPEGLMVKNKKIFEKGHYMITQEDIKRPPHTGVATLALRTEFYRQRLKCMSVSNPDEARRLLDLFEIDSLNDILDLNTYIVPVNITYYPIRARENFLSNMIVHFKEDVPDRLMEEMMTEGNMLFSGVDIDIRFGQAITIDEYLDRELICKDVSAIEKFNFDDHIPSRPVMKEAVYEIMNKYMSSIYNLTTVNHEHLFASVLRLIPFNKFDENDLKERVFYAIINNIEKTNIYLHESINMNQTHLLTDDRYEKFSKFIEMAIDKKIIKKQDNTLIKDASLFFSAYGFHNIRINNPVEVIANEIEPLVKLTRHLKKIVLLPRAWIKMQIRKYLYNKTNLDYEKDYKKFYIEGESKDYKKGMPYLLKGNNFNKTGIIVVHGYMASPLEVKELAVYLNNNGFWIHAPRLKGHGTSPEDLATRTYKDWIESVDESYALLSYSCKRVYVCGFSFGAGLALDIASRIKDIKGVIAVCPPMRLQDISAKFVPAVNVWNKLMKKVKLDSVSKEFVENDPENPHINYHRNPISGVRELEKLMNKLNPRLNKIVSPALIIQSDGDPVVNPKGSKMIFEKLSSEIKEYRLFNFNRHGILLGENSSRVHKAINDFIKNIEKKNL